MKRSGTFRSGLRRAALFLVPVVLLVAGFAFYLWYNRPTSSPSAVRPWAEAAFNDLVNPRPSPGSPLDPQYSTKVVRLEEKSPNPSDTSSSDRLLEMELLPATETFVSPFPVHTFDAAEGMTSGDMSVRVKWLATHWVAGHLDKGPSHTDFRFFDGSGMPLDPGASKSAEEEFNFHFKNGGQPMMSYYKSRRLFCKFEVAGFKRPFWDFKGAYDEETRVPLFEFARAITSEREALVQGTLTNVFDRPLLFVFDMVHGQEETFDISPASGTTVESPDFRLKVLQMAGRRISISNDLGWHHADPLLYTSQYLSTEVEHPITSVVIHAGPSAIWDSLSVEAILADGRTGAAVLLPPEASPYGKSEIRESEPIRLFHFNVEPSEIKHLRIRRTPLKDRFVMRVKSVPGLQQVPPDTTDLFDVSASTVVFQDPYEMEIFIENAIQFESQPSPWTVTFSSSRSPSPGFPMTIEHATPRKVLSRYRSLPGNRKAFIDSKEMTIMFEGGIWLSWHQRALDAAKNVLGIP